MSMTLLLITKSISTISNQNKQNTDEEFRMNEPDFVSVRVQQHIDDTPITRSIQPTVYYTNIASGSKDSSIEFTSSLVIASTTRTIDRY